MLAPTVSYVLNLYISYLKCLLYVKLLLGKLTNIGYLSAFEITSSCFQGHTQGKEESFMHNYELVVIIHPDLDDEAIEQALDRIRGWITDGGGSVDTTDKWGKRRLSYEIQKQNEGIYYLLDVSMLPTSVAELEKNMMILEPVMRHMIVAK